MSMLFRLASIEVQIQLYKHRSAMFRPPNLSAVYASEALSASSPQLSKLRRPRILREVYLDVSFDISTEGEEQELR